MIKRLLGKSDKYESTQRKIKNLEKELKALGTKRLSSKEEQRFYKRYNAIMESIQNNKKKFSDVENQQLHTNISSLGARYSFLDKIEQKDQEGSVRRYYLRSENVEEDKVKPTTTHIDDYTAIKNDLENLHSELKSTNSSSLNDDLIKTYELKFKSLTGKIINLKSVRNEALRALLDQSRTCFQNLIEEKNSQSVTKSYSTNYPSREFRNSSRYRSKDENSFGMTTYGYWNKPSANTPRSEKLISSSRGSGFEPRMLQTDSFSYENEKEKKDRKEKEDFPKVHEFGKGRQTSSVFDNNSMDASRCERNSTPTVPVYKEKFEQMDRDYHQVRYMSDRNRKVEVSTRTNNSSEDCGILKHDSHHSISSPKHNEEIVVAEEAQESSFFDTQKEFEYDEKKSNVMVDLTTKNENKTPINTSNLSQTYTSRSKLNESQIRESQSCFEKETQTSFDNIKSSRINNFSQITAKEAYYRDKNLNRESLNQMIGDGCRTPGKVDYKNTYKKYHFEQEPFESYKSKVSHVESYQSELNGNQIKNQEVVCSVVEHPTATKPQEVKEQPLQILDVHQYFRDDFDFDSVESLDVVDRIKALHGYAKTFEDRVKNFNEEKFSLDYFVIDEKLMCLIEKLDKIRCQHDDQATQRKVEVINYIKNLHVILDERAKDD